MRQLSASSPSWDRKPAIAEDRPSFLHGIRHVERCGSLLAIEFSIPEQTRAMSGGPLLLAWLRPVFLTSSASTGAAVPQPARQSLPDLASLPPRSLLARIGTFPFVLAALVVMKIFGFALSGVGDNDIFWHLRNGQFMTAQHRFPSVDAYSYTAAGMPWLSHEWLSEFIYYTAFRAFHLQGLWIITAFLPAITACVMFYLAFQRSRDPFGAGIATLLGTALMSVGDGPRMHHFGWLCFVGIFAILQRFRLRRTGPLWTIPILFCLWINLHGSWPFGMVIFGLIFLAGFVKEDIGRIQAAPWTPAERLKLLVTGAASAAAVFINPFGSKLVFYPADLFLHQKLNLDVVQEWRVLAFSGATGVWVGITLAILLIGTALTGVRWRLDDLALTILVFYCGFSHERMFLPAGIILATVLAPFLTGLSSYDPAQERTRLNLALLAGILVAMVVLFPSEKKLQSKIDRTYPLRAVQYLRLHGGRGRLFNEYNWGGYLEWTMPEQRTFIDSRTDIFEHKGVLREFVDVIRLKHPEKVMEKYQIDSVLITPGTDINVWFDLQPNWHLAYHDAISAVYVRNP
jgi:hypothetical protein